MSRLLEFHLARKKTATSVIIGAIGESVLFEGSTREFPSNGNVSCDINIPEKIMLYFNCNREGKRYYSKNPLINAMQKLDVRLDFPLENYLDTVSEERTFIFLVPFKLYPNSAA